MIAATEHGNVYALKVEKDDQGIEYIERPTLVYTTEHEVVIWDLTVLNSPQKL